MLPSNKVRQDDPAACNGNALTHASLADAFSQFGKAATSLEHCYDNLRNEVTSLRRELHQKNEELVDARRDVQRMQALAELSTELAHQLRNPLAALELQIGLLMQCGEMREETLRWSEQLQAGIRTLTAITNNVLQFHSLATGTRESLSIENLLSDTVAFLEPLARQARVDITCEDQTQGTLIQGTPQLLQQALVNLALVSFPSVEPGRHFHFLADRDATTNSVLVRLNYNGPGIANEWNKSSKPDSLHMCITVARKIMEDHGATIESASNSTGTTYTMRFPSL